MSFSKKVKVYDSDDDTSNETFVVYGTELPDASSEQDNGKYVPLWKQEVLIDFLKSFFFPSSLNLFLFLIDIIGP
jgi:hypothetical protein